MSEFSNIYLKQIHWELIWSWSALFNSLKDYFELENTMKRPLLDILSDEVLAEIPTWEADLKILEEYVLKVWEELKLLDEDEFFNLDVNKGLLSKLKI